MVQEICADDLDDRRRPSCGDGRQRRRGPDLRSGSGDGVVIDREAQGGCHGGEELDGVAQQILDAQVVEVGMLQAEDEALVVDPSLCCFAGRGFV